MLFPWLDFSGPPETPPTPAPYESVTLRNARRREGPVDRRTRSQTSSLVPPALWWYKKFRLSLIAATTS